MRLCVFVDLSQRRRATFRHQEELLRNRQARALLPAHARTALLQKLAMAIGDPRSRRSRWASARRHIADSLSFPGKFHPPVGWAWAPRSVSAAARILSRSGCRSEEHTSELQSHLNLVCRLLLEKKKIITC